jgi:carboxylesterase
MLIPTAEPFFFPGNETGCLLIHGFTGTPKEMRWMGEYLNQQGFSVMAIRLAAHATKQDDLQRVTWQDWAASVEDGWYMLQNIARRIYVIGLSMGGVLALNHTSNFPVAGAIAMSTPYDLPRDPRVRFLKLLRRVLPSVPKGPPDWHNPQASLDHVDYPEYPTKGIIQMNNLLVNMRAGLPKIEVPVLLVHSKVDSGVAPENMTRIYSDLGSTDKQMLWLENSGHVITREPEREQVFQAAFDFIARVNETTR